MRWLLCALLILSVPGCSGCRDPEARKKAELARKAAEAKKKKEKKKPKPDFEIGPPAVLPHEDAKKSSYRIKPGHWVGISQLMRANNFDFQGQITWTPLDRTRRKVALDRTGYRMALSRPLALAKKQQQMKAAKMVLFAPVSGTTTSFFTMHLSGRGGRRYASRLESFQLMKPHEYFFVVLGTQSLDYGFLGAQYTITQRTTGIGTATKPHYRVLLPNHQDPAPLPTSLLTATNTAVILWDDMDPNDLSTEQQVALIDWLKWGGQLLISGPNSMSNLRGSFLEPYLPARGGKAIELATDDLQLVNKDWSAPYPQYKNRPLKTRSPWRAIELELPDTGPNVFVAASTADGTPLVVERRVGRGRVVVSAFRMNERELVHWPGFDGFLNCCLLRRPPRKFLTTDEGLQFEWSGRTVFDAHVRQRLESLDPRTVSRLRLFSRDAGFAHSVSVDPVEAFGSGDVIPVGPGIGGWNDFNTVSEAARTTVRDAAGIEIPSSQFVLKVLAAYLIVLVPLNWGVFRAIGRIEWAWAAAPLISLACAGCVIKLAELDIGFARSNTEIAVVELQPDYPRAHVTRFNALYTSLSTPYSVTFDDADALVQPFAVSAGYNQVAGTTPPTVECQRGADVSMTGFHVLSNRTGLIHSEQMIDLGGSFTIATRGDQMTVKNSTNYNLQRTALVRPVDERTIKMAWIGPLPANQSVSAEFETVSIDSLQQRWTVDGGVDTSRVKLNLWPMIKATLASEEMERGEVRMVGVVLDQEFPGITISPAAPQKRTAAVVVAHLQYTELRKPRPDQNSIREFERKPLATDGSERIE
ncbi:MAG: hypothetical protein WBF93_22065 [Pirellulales bacterium]